MALTRARLPSGRTRRLLLLSLAAVLLAATAVLFGVAWIGSERAIHPRPRTSQHQPKLLGLDVERVEFPSADGVPLAGWFVAGNNGATVILIPGYAQTRHQMLPYARFLRDAGFNTLLYDPRAGGESGGTQVTLGLRERGDVRGALDYLGGRADVDPRRVGVLGQSLGAATALLAAAETPGLRAVVADSAFKSIDSSVEQAFEQFIDLPRFPFAPLTVLVTEARLGARTSDVAPEREIGRISPRPVLIVHGLADQTLGADDARALYSAAGEPKELWLVPGAGHSGAREKAPREYARRVSDFFLNALR